jgi:tetratricopeptide (TPR) repeat protein
MKRFMFLAVLLLAAVLCAHAQFDELITSADAHYDEDRYDEAIADLEEALSEAGSGSERAEVYWRLSRATLSVGDRQIDNGRDEATILETFEQGEDYGRQAIEADPSNHLGYYWTSANVGKWGQTRGIVNSLIKAAPMRDLLAEAIEREPDHADSYYVLGQLYAQVPGFISFGNVNYAVSFGRKSVDLETEQTRNDPEEEFNQDMKIQLASHLIQRDWNRRKRDREQSDKAQKYRSTSNLLEKNFHYEGVVDLPRMDDKEEARELLEEAIAALERKSDRSDGEDRNLEEARTLLNDL